MCIIISASTAVVASQLWTICERHQVGEPVLEIAARRGVSRSTASNIGRWRRNSRHEVARRDELIEMVGRVGVAPRETGLRSIELRDRW